MTNALLEVREVERYFGAKCAVSSLSFSIPARACVGIVGLNGAGKSTILRLLAGLSAPTKGTITLLSERVSPDAHAVRANIGFLPERPPLYDAMSVAKYLAFAAELRGVSHAKVHAAVTKALEATALSHVRDELISTLSHGYRQRVGIAQAIVHEPKLVILDEPSQGLDPAQSLAMQELLRSLAQERAVLLSTHLIRDVQRCCDRVLLIHEGRLVAEGSEATLAARFGRVRETRVTLTVRGDESLLRSAIEAVPHVTHVEVQTKDEQLTFDVDSDVDVRAELSRVVVQAGGDLLALCAREDGFDVLFRALSSEERGAA